MAKALKTIGMIAGAVALVATGVGAFAAAGTALASTAASVATYAGLAASVAAVGANALQKPPPARGSVSQVIVALDPPRPLVMGEGYVGGVVRHDVAYGGTVSKVPNPYLWQVHVFCGCGPVQSITPYADFGTIGSYYSGFLYTDTQLGACPESSALTPHWAGATGWSSASRLSGCAAIGFNAKFDKDGKKFGNGLPGFGAYGQWAFAYDPRKDSTRSGGSGSHRLNDASTWGWSQCPALFAGTYAYGYYQNGKLVMGMGLPDEAIDWTYVADWANVCDANDWTIFGRVFEPGGPELRWANLTDICIAGGGKPVFAGGRLSFHYSAPRVSLGTITAAALAEGTQRVTGQKSYAQRVNAVVPKYIDADSNWELIPAEKVVASTLVAEDGEEKLEEFPFNLVKDVNQAAELAMYRVWDSREITVPEVPLLPGYETIRPGECWTFDLPDMGLIDRDCIVWSRTVDPGTFGTKLALETETTEKHAFALGLTGVPPGTPTLATGAELRDDIAQAISVPDYSDGTPIDDLRPAEPNATEGAPTGTEVAGRLAEVVNSLTDLNATDIIEQALRQDDAQIVLDARTFVDGQPVNTVFVTFRNTQTDINSVVNSVLTLLGAKTEDGTAWVLDTSTVRINPDTTVAQKFTEIGAANDAVSADVSSLQEVVLGPDGEEARSLVKARVADNVATLVVGATGDESVIAFQADNTVIMSADGETVLATFGEDADGAYIPDLKVDRLKVGTRGSTNGGQVVTSGSSISGTGASNYITIISDTVTLDAPGTVTAMASVAQSFPSGDDTWNIRLRIDGTEVFAAGGQKTQDVATVSGALYLPAGTYTVDVRWAAPSGVSNSGKTLNTAVLY